MSYLRWSASFVIKTAAKGERIRILPVSGEKAEKRGQVHLLTNQCSLWHCVHETGVPWLAPGPVEAGEGWLEYVNRPETEGELAALRRSVVRGAPWGHPAWQQRTAERLGLESALRNRGRPHKKRAEK